MAADELLTVDRPLAIAMLDFSWLERRWPGAGYEDWDGVLDGLLARGYDAVRVDVFPHLLAQGRDREWTLLPVWDQQVWGSPAVNRVQVWPGLIEFLAKCRVRGLRVAMSTWFREDAAAARSGLTTPEAFSEAWLKALRMLAGEGLLEGVLWVDLCNEWPGDLWAPYFRNDPPELTWGGWHTEVSMAWMRESLRRVRAEFPRVPLCFSTDGMDDEMYRARDLRGIGFGVIEHHCWMAKENRQEFFKAVGYGFERFSPQGYSNLAAKGEAVYRERPAYWQGLLTERIASLASASRAACLPLATTECWGVVDYKDWPLLDWGWVKELCEVGVTAASATGRWAAVATSNFCAPQFAGMWRDVAWHQRLTRRIKDGPLDPELRSARWS